MAAKRAKEKALLEKEAEAELQAMMDELGGEEEDMDDEDRQLLALMEEDEDDEPPKPPPSGKAKMDTFKQSFSQPIDMNEDSTIPVEPPPPVQPKPSTLPPPAQPQPTSKPPQPSTPTQPPPTSKPPQPDAQPQPQPTSPTTPPKQATQPQQKPQQSTSQPSKPTSSSSKPTKPAKPQQPPPPPTYVNEPDTKNDQYDQLFTTFADSFYSLIHSKHNQDKYIEQINKLLPVVVEGPSKPVTGKYELFEPKLKAPDHREYKDFKKDPISIALHPDEIDNVIQEIKSDMLKIGRDYKVLKENGMKNSAAVAYNVLLTLKSSIQKLREEPYYIDNVFIYRMPIFDDSLKTDTIRIELFEGKHFPKGNYIPAFIVPTLKGPKTIAFAHVSGPDFKINKAILVPCPLQHSLNYMKMILNQENQLAFGIYEIKGSGKKEIVSGYSTTLAPLIRTHEIRKTAVFQELESATIDFRVSVNTSLGLSEVNVTERKIKAHPSCLFKMPKAKKGQPAASQPGKAAAQPGKAAAQPGKAAAQPGKAAAQPGKAAAQPTAGAAPPQPKQVQFPYIFTQEELQMFWSAKVLLFYVESINKSKDECAKKNCPIPDGINAYQKALQDKYAIIEQSINEGKWSPEQYTQMLDQAIKREQARIPTLPQNKIQEHEFIIYIMQTEFKEMQEML